MVELAVDGAGEARAMEEPEEDDAMYQRRVEMGGKSLGISNLR